MARKTSTKKMYSFLEFREIRTIMVGSGKNGNPTYANWWQLMFKNIVSSNQII